MEEVTQDQYIKSTKEIILTHYSPTHQTAENSSLLTTHQIREKINDFTAFALEPYIIHHAMIQGGFITKKIGERIYWLLEEK
jgi:hypothetical protein